MIPKILIQSSRDQKPSQFILDKLNRFTGSNWTYVHFTNKEMFEYLKTNALDEFPQITNQMLKINSGPHKADLFRYYYLYKNGGVYIDSDAMIEQDINYLVENYDFFTVNGIAEDSCFQGFIGSAPGNKIIKAALDHALTIDPMVIRNNYSVFTDHLGKIIKDSDKTNVKLLAETLLDLKLDSKNYTKTSLTYDPENLTLVLIHYFHDKIIPINNIMWQTRPAMDLLRPDSAEITNSNGELYFIKVWFESILNNES
jgi:hypothetical protein